MKIKSSKDVMLRVFLILGLLLSLFLLYEHFSESSSEFCTFGESFDCGIVNKSPYSTLDGISYLLTLDYGLSLPLVDLSQYGVVIEFLTTNSFLGFLTLLFLFFLCLNYQKKGFLWIKKDDVLKWMKCISLFSILYGAYLIYIQHSLLKSYCIFCLALDVTLLIIFILVWRLK
jgi:uncharacterized membrane protein